MAQAETETGRPDASLVMAAWKPHPGWLREAVEAALSQRGCMVELIVVDDGSPEPVADLLAEVADPRLRVVRVEHGGVAAARNAGTAAARSELIRFIDADDRIPATSTARLAGLIGGRDDVIAYGATLFSDEEMRPLWKMTCSLEGNVVDQCLLGRFTVRPHALLFPRAVVEAVGDWDTGTTGVAEDWDFVLRALDHAGVRGTHEVVSIYRRHGSAATANAEAGVAGAARVLERYLARHPERAGTGFERRARAYGLALGGRVFMTHGEPRRGARMLVAATRLDPRAVVTEFDLGLRFAASRLSHALRRSADAPPSAPDTAPTRATRR